MTEFRWPLIMAIAAELDAAGIAYLYRGATALFVQEVPVPDLHELEVTVQWDLFEEACQLLAPHSPEPVERSRGRAAVRFERSGTAVLLECIYDTVVQADPERVPVNRDGRTIWARSLDYYLRHLPAGDPRVALIRQSLREQQQAQSRASEAAWTEGAYEAWVTRLGRPAEAAARIKEDPVARLKYVRPYLGELRGKKVINLLGSHGSKAVAMALLGARAAVADFSPGNARYAAELAREAGVDLRYIVSDVLELPSAERTGDYDLVLMELGILHYFLDLKPLFGVVSSLLGPGGRLVLQDFHPVSTKLITSKGKKHKVTGNYFAKGLAQTQVAFSKYLVESGGEGGGVRPASVRLRKWTLGQVVTAVAAEGLRILTLDEEPNTKLEDTGLPKTFTLVAEKLP